MNSITQRDEARLMTGRPPRRGASDGPKLYTAHTVFSQKKKKSSFFFSCPLPHLHRVNVSTCLRFPGHSQVLKVNTFLTSSRRISYIIKAVSRAICIILSNWRQSRLQWCRPCRTNSADEVWGDDIQMTAARQDASHW